jgi:hypothetical protein
LRTAHAAYNSRRRLDTRALDAMFDIKTRRPNKFTLPRRCHGYLLWLLPGARRQFAILEFSGNMSLSIPSRLVMVQTALNDTDEVWRLWSALVAQFGQD